MGGHIRGDVKKGEVSRLHSAINKEVFTAFKNRCKEMNYPMNVLLEIFMQQYVNGRYKIKLTEIAKWMEDSSETENLNTTFNKEIYSNFKSLCKDKGFYVKHILTVFMNDFADGKFMLEYIDTAKVKRKNKKV